MSRDEKTGVRYLEGEENEVELEGKAVVAACDQERKGVLHEREEANHLSRRWS